MKDLQRLYSWNVQGFEAYCARTPPYQRLANRLRSLYADSPEQNSALLAAFAALYPTEQERLADIDMAELLALVAQMQVPPAQAQTMTIALAPQECPA